MADLIIRGMKMPRNCLDCKIRRDWLTCPILDRYVMNNKTDRHPDCPLGPLPEGHGRLIDANELELDLVRHNGAIGFELIGNAPTIVPAEGGNADA